MKKRSMLAIASLAAGVVTALVSPPQDASATEAGGPAAGVTGLLQEDAGVGSLVGETVEGAGGGLQAPEAGGLL
ncbi:hypothetical protein ACFY7C_01670 [Streptomyces sp. NPDC012769]|uniref:hypothetical protein n=1 Tax=Streptomyces sp. NPDC012769 TaxID=3364848 RepID=UPI00368DD662